VRLVLASILVLGGLAGQAPHVAAQDPPVLLATEPGDTAVSPVAVASVQRLAVQALAKLSGTFVGGAKRPIRIVLHADAGSLPPAVAADLHPGTAGLALLGRDEIHILLDEAVREPPNDLRTVVVHELVHALLDQHAGDGAAFVPRWVHEGLAQTLSGGAYLGIEEENLLFAVSTRSGFRFTDLVLRFPRRDDLLRLAYAQSYSFVAYLVDRVGAEGIVEAARRCRADHAFDLGLLEVAGESQARFQAAWEDYILYGSGALPRLLLRNCFSLLVVLAVPLLIVAARQRLQRNRWRKQQLATAEALAAEALAAGALRRDEDEQ